MTACLAFEANVSRRPAVTTVISVGRMKHTHSYHDCTKWFKLDFTFKESTFVLGTENPTQFLWLGNLYFSEFPRSAFHLQNTMLTNYILFFLPGYKIIVPWEKKIKAWHRQEDRHPNKTQTWIWFVSICPCDYLLESDMLSSSMQDSVCHERSMSTWELGIG